MKRKLYFGKIDLLLTFVVPAFMLFCWWLEFDFEIRMLFFLGGFSFGWIFLMIFATHKNLLSLFIIYDEGMRYTYLSKVTKTIKWNEINEIKILKIQKSEYKKMPNKIYRHVGGIDRYLVFSTNKILDTFETNYNSNLCIWKPNKKIYTAITPHLPKLQEQHQEEIKKFFEKTPSTKEGANGLLEA